MQNALEPALKGHTMQKYALAALLFSLTTSARADDLAALSDEFNNASTLSQWRRVYAVEAWNANQLELLDFNATRPGKLVMMTYTSTWYQDWRGELTFKDITGDVVVTSDVEVSQRGGTGAPRSQYSLGGLMIRSQRSLTPATWTPGGENYIFLSLGAADQPGSFQYEVKTTQNSATNLWISAGSSRATLQLARVGPYVIALRKDVGGSWVVHHRFVRNDLTPGVQVGMCVYTDFPSASQLSPFEHNSTVIHSGNPDLVAAYDYVPFRRPVLPQSLQGKNLADPSAVTDAQLLSFLGANADGSSSGPGPSCTASAQNLCLSGGRFRVSVNWKNQYAGGTTGTGTAVALTGDTGYFWFFDAANVELVIKVLDGRSSNGHFWGFYGGLSDVEYTITGPDTQNSVIRTYRNAPGTLASVADTAAF